MILFIISGLVTLYIESDDLLPFSFWRFLDTFVIILSAVPIFLLYLQRFIKLLLKVKCAYQNPILSQQMNKTFLENASFPYLFGLL